MKANNNSGLTARIPIKNKQGEIIDYKEVATYRGLLAKAHEEGLKSIETNLIQLPQEQNKMTAVVGAKVMTDKGLFTGLGDANPANVTAKIAPHILRMAETRAKARALRDAVNIGLVCLDELGAELEDGALVEEREAGPFPPETPAASSPVAGKEMAANGPPAAPENNAEPLANNQTSASNNNQNAAKKDGLMTESQRRYLFRLLAERSLMGEEAKKRLQEALQVPTLKQATKASASLLIERILQGEEV